MTAKKNTSFRLTQDRIDMLDKLVDYYKQQAQESTSYNFDVQVSRTTVVDMLIFDKYQELERDGELE